MKKLIALLLPVCLLAGSSTALNCSAEKDKDTSVKSTTVAEEIQNGTILHAFCWDFNTIKESMADIAAAGYSAVQTSPINTCSEGENGGMELYGDGKWYYHYQPTDYAIGNYQFGSRDEFIAMCNEAHKHNVRVIVDVMANHTTPVLDDISENFLNIGGGNLDNLLHKNSHKTMSDYSDRLQCTTYSLFGPDINTELPAWQNYFFDFINDCSDCGVDGFRYDSAKHIGLPDDPRDDENLPNNFWEKVKTETKDYDNKFIYAEVLQGDNDRLEEYIRCVGRTPASHYGEAIRSALANKNLSVSAVQDYQIGNAPKNIVTWVESHDTYCNDDGQTWKQISDEQVVLGWAIITARKDGTPLMFDRPYHSTQSAEWGMNRIGTQGEDTYKDSRVSALNYFRRAMVGEDEKLLNPDKDTTALVIERGKKGLVIVNTDNELKTGFSVGLADGKYTDRADNTTVYTVKNGKLTSEKPIAQNTVVILYNDGYQPPLAVANVGVVEDTVFKTEEKSMEITLTLENAEQGTYTINGGQATPYRNADKITVEKPADGNIAKIELRAVSKDNLPVYERIEITFKRTYYLFIAIGTALGIVLLLTVFLLLKKIKKNKKIKSVS